MIKGGNAMTTAIQMPAFFTTGDIAACRLVTTDQGKTWWCEDHQRRAAFNEGWMCRFL